MAKEEKRQSTKELKRLFQLDSLFQQDRFYTKEQLAKKLNISIPTLDRDFARLREEYSAPLEWSKENGGYHYTSRLFKLPAVFVPEHEMPAYSIVLKLFEQFQNTPLYAPLLDICEAFEAPIETRTFGYSSYDKIDFQKTNLVEEPWFETRIVMGKRTVAAVDDAHWDIILQALKNNQVIEFDYENVTVCKKAFSRTIEPWQLVYDSEQWYLRGFASTSDNPKEKAMRTFVVPRMKNLKLVAQYFSLPEEKIWRLDEHNVGSFGALATDNVETYQFIFQGTALYYSEADFAPDKKVEKYTGNLPHKDGAVLVTFKSNQPVGIKRAFFPYGEDIIPLAPQSFVEDWKETIRKMTAYL